MKSPNSKSPLPDSVGSWQVRIPISLMNDLRWIRENSEEQNIPFSRIVERAVKRYKRDMERKS